MDYVQEFNDLAQYAPEFVSPNKQKQDYFMDGLSTKMQKRLSAHSLDDFSMMVSKSDMMEYKMKKHQDRKILKREEQLSDVNNEQYVGVGQSLLSHAMVVEPRESMCLAHSSQSQEATQKQRNNSRCSKRRSCFYCG